MGDSGSPDRVDYFFCFVFVFVLVFCFLNQHVTTNQHELENSSYSYLRVNFYLVLLPSSFTIFQQKTKTKGRREDRQGETDEVGFGVWMRGA